MPILPEINQDPVQPHELALASPATDILSVAGDQDTLFIERAPFQRLERVATSMGLFALATSAYLFEQSPANEKIRGSVGVSVFRLIQSSPEYVGTAVQRIETGLAVGGSVGAITLGIEVASGLATAATLSRDEGLLGKFNRLISKIARKTDIKDKKGRSKGDVMLGLGGGASLVVLKRNAIEEDRTFNDNARTAVRAAGGIALFSAVVGGATGEVVRQAAEMGHEIGAQQALDIIADSKTWLGLFGLNMGYAFIKTRIDGLRGKQDSDLIRGEKTEQLIKGGEDDESI